METTEADSRRETIQEWMTRVGDGRSNRALAEDKRVRVHHQALSRWVAENKMPADKLVTLARVFDADVLEALCVGGYIEHDDIRRGLGAEALRQAQETDLVDELHRRTHARAARELALRELASGATGELPAIRLP